MNVYAVLNASGEIVNRIVIDNGETYERADGETIVADSRDVFHIGGKIVGGTYIPPAPPEMPDMPPADDNPVPASISDRQFFQQLAIAGVISQEDALAAVKTGAIPSALQGFVDAIVDDDQRFAANMLLSGATVFERTHPLTDAIGAAQSMTPDQVDNFFRAAAAL